MSAELLYELSGKGYWPAVAKEYFDKVNYSRAIELCNMRLKESPETLSGKIILARALFHSGQAEAAEKLYYEILEIDAENIVSLKYLGDIKFKAGDEATAFSYYQKVMQIDPFGDCLNSSVEQKKPELTKTLTLTKGREIKPVSSAGLKSIPFKTETIGDLLLAQGHTRMALDVFSELAKSGSPRIQKKLEETKEALKAGKGKDV